MHANSKARTLPNMQVYVLRHRIPSVAKRRHPYNANKREQLQKRLFAEEEQGSIYVTHASWHNKLTKMLYIFDKCGDRIDVWPSDVIRV